jgi:hypothetical protein
MYRCQEEDGEESGRDKRDPLDDQPAIQSRLGMQVRSIEPIKGIRRTFQNGKEQDQLPSEKGLFIEKTGVGIGKPQAEHVSEGKPHEDVIEPLHRPTHRRMSEVMRLLILPQDIVTRS